VSRDDRPGWRTDRLVDTPWLQVAHLTAGKDGDGEELQSYRRNESLFVLDGESRLRLAAGEQVVQAGSWLRIPADVAHALVPAGRVRMLEFESPGVAQGGGPSALVVPPGGGETIADRPGRRAILLAETEELAVTEFTYGAGEPGPDPHVHRAHADVFVVLEGALTIKLRESALDATAGTLVVVPPNVVHSYANETVDQTRILNLHTPASGFGDYLRGRYPGFDQHAPPDDGGGDPAAIVVARIDRTAGQ
jgi:mannose-6-phosphate isomerase-like protein (cupin superfamily)